ncbi:Vacuolar sorting-associated protein 13C [Nymphaea thermarum]|nr:Vacuolar sorting-associated protein 13C [Nymphaea thermarum]
MLKDQVAFLLQKYLGNYIRGLSADALKISVWQGDVELTNMQLKPEALNALKLPVRVKTGFLGSVRLKVPWSRLGQEPVQVYLDRICILVEPATQVVGCYEDGLLEAKKNLVREMERKLLEARQHQKVEVNTTWLGSLINTIIGNLKLSISNIHIRYEDLESNPGHPFAAGATLTKLSAVTVDESGKETFATGGALGSIQKFVELDRLAFYFDSDSSPLTTNKPWEDLLPSEWSQIFGLATGETSSDSHINGHNYILQPVSGNAKYAKKRVDESRSLDQPLQRATVYLDNVVLCLSKDEYRDILKMADNFSAFNKRLKYAHYRPDVGIKTNPRVWWKYAFRVTIDQCKKASGRLSWDQVLRYTKLLKRYVSLYASLLRSNLDRSLIDDHKEIEELDRQLDVEVIVQWRSGQPAKDGSEAWSFSEEDWELLNRMIGYKEGEDERLMEPKGNMLHSLFEVYMRRNASKLVGDNQKCLAELSCDALDCSIQLYEERKIFDLKLGSYRLNSPSGLLAESADRYESLVAKFTYMPVDVQLDWSLIARASPCYVTYLKDSIDEIVSFFRNSADISQAIALETAAAVQMTIDGVKRTAQQQISKALKDRTRFFLDLDIAAPKVTIPTAFFPEDYQATKLLLDLGHFTLCSQDDHDSSSVEEEEMFLKFKLELKDISAFLIDGDYSWGERSLGCSASSSQQNAKRFLPVLDKCGVVVKLQQYLFEILNVSTIHQRIVLVALQAKHRILYGKQIWNVPPEYVGNEDHVLAICDGGWLPNMKDCMLTTSMQTSASITNFSESSTDDGSSSTTSIEATNGNDSIGNERLFIIGVLDELRINFCNSYKTKQNFKEMLLAEESHLLEFRAIGGQVELSIRVHDMRIGTVLKSMEIEDLYSRQGKGSPRYVARSFIECMEHESISASSFDSNSAQTKNDDEKFFEASESLVDAVDYHESPFKSSEDIMAKFAAESAISSKEPPSFSRIPGLLPVDVHDDRGGISIGDTLDNFVKAQIIIHDIDSPAYSNIDKEVIISLATLSFFCYRPTILAIFDFVNSINWDDGAHGSGNKIHGSSSTSDSANIIDDHTENLNSKFQDTVARGLLGKGKYRVMFSLSLNMANAWILLMKEDGTPLATLSQNNLHTHIRVFQSSFSINAALGNLKISDNSLTPTHDYFWICDMRDPTGSSFVELEFSSFSVDDDDYEGYDYGLSGQLSEITNYFIGLVPTDPTTVIKLKDQVTNTEKWFTTSEIEGSPAIRFDLSLQKPIILMPRGTNSHDFLELDVLHITVQNEFHWYSGDKNNTSAVHLEILTLEIEGIDLSVGTGKNSGENIIEDINGVTVVIRRSLRDLFHQIPDLEMSIKLAELKAALSCKEYHIISECALSNISETPNAIPPFVHENKTEDDILEQNIAETSHVRRFSSQVQDEWAAMKVFICLDFVELSVHSGASRDSALATFQIDGATVMYKSRSSGESSVFATLKHFSVIDDREVTQQEFKLAIGGPDNIDNTVSDPVEVSEFEPTKRSNDILKYQMPVVTMLIIDINFQKSVTSVSLSIQRPQLLVALDFLLALVEFFIPNLFSEVSNQNTDSLDVIDAIVLDQPVYFQPYEEFSLSPQKPLIADCEGYDHYIYDGKGGFLSLQDTHGNDLSNPSDEAIIYVGNGKFLQFKNVTIEVINLISNGEYLDSCISLGSDSRYSASSDDLVYLQKDDNVSAKSYSKAAEYSLLNLSAKNSSSLTKIVIELQAIGPELTFYTTSKDVGEPSALPTKLLHVQFDLFSRVIMEKNDIEMSGDVLGLTMESNGIRVIEPFDSSITFSKVSGKTNIHLSISDIVMNFSFSILQLFLEVEQDILAFLRISKEVTIVCSQFDRVGMVHDEQRKQVYAFWRPRAPPGFSVLCDYLTPLNEPPTRGVIAVNANFARVKRPLSFKLVWSALFSQETFESKNHKSCEPDSISISQQTDSKGIEGICSIWFPVAPPGYVALGCVASSGRNQPPLSSVLCIMEKLVSPCGLRDCIIIHFSEQHANNQEFWRVNNSVGSFLPEDPTNKRLVGKAYELRHMLFSKHIESSTPSDIQHVQGILPDDNICPLDSERAAVPSSGRRYEVIGRFSLIWWNRESSPRKKISIWRPIVPQGMVFFGDIAMQNYEPPSTVISLHHDDNHVLLKAPLGFQLVGHVKKQKGVDSISFWLPEAPPGYVALGCIASKLPPKLDEFQLLRCIRSDMVVGDQFPDESLWDTSELRRVLEPFSLWTLHDRVGTFLVRSGLKKPPKRLALRLVVANASSQSDDFVIDAEVKTFSVTLFDDYGGMRCAVERGEEKGRKRGKKEGKRQRSRGLTLELPPSPLPLLPLLRPPSSSSSLLTPPPCSSLRRVAGDRKGNEGGTERKAERKRSRALHEHGARMVPLFNFSLSSVAVGVHGKPGVLNSSVSFSSVAKSFNDKNDCWEPFIEPVDGFIRYQYDISAPGMSSQLRITSTRDLNINVSVSNINLILQAYASWSSLSQVNESYKMMRHDSFTFDGGYILDIHHKRAYYIIPENKLGRDIFLRAFESGGISKIFSLQSADAMPIKVPVSKSMWGSHIKSINSVTSRKMIAVMITEGEFPCDDLVNTHQYMVAIRISQNDCMPVSKQQQQTARTCFINSECNSDGLSLAKWNEIFFFKIESERICTGKSDIFHGRIRCGIVIFSCADAENEGQLFSEYMEPGSLQISPGNHGPWTTLRLNYAAHAACWRLGNDIVASEVTLRDGDRHIAIRSLVYVVNSTDLAVDLALRSNFSRSWPIDHYIPMEKGEIITEEFFEVQIYDPQTGWVHHHSDDSSSLDKQQKDGQSSQMVLPAIELPPGWEWVDDWNVDTSLNTIDGWVYSSDLEGRKWPNLSGHEKSLQHVRQRKWKRNRRKIPDSANKQILGLLKPGESIPLSLSSLTAPGIVEILPKSSSDESEYSWSSFSDRYIKSTEYGHPDEVPQFCLSSLVEAEDLLHCPFASGSSSEDANGLWFCLSTQATEIGKDIHSNSIQDWKLVLIPPLSFINFLPLSVELSVLERKPCGAFAIRSRGVLHPGEKTNVYSADMHNPLIVEVILEQNLGVDQQIAKVIRIYSPYWIEFSRCPPLTCRLVSLPVKGRYSSSLLSNKDNEDVVEFTNDEMVDGCTIGSVINFGNMGMSVTMSGPDKQVFGPVSDLSLLGGLGGSIIVKAYDTDKKCIRLLVSAKPCPYQSVPTKVITIRPFMTFTNRYGQDIYLKLNTEDEPKILHSYDSRVSFAHHENGDSEKLQGDAIAGAPVDVEAILKLRSSPPLRQRLSTHISLLLREARRRRRSTTHERRHKSDAVKGVTPAAAETVVVVSDKAAAAAAAAVAAAAVAAAAVAAAAVAAVTAAAGVTVVAVRDIRVRLDDTDWCFPLQIRKEDNITLVLRMDNGERRFVKTEIRGYEEGSRFLIVFRLASINGPIRIENRAPHKLINVCQSGLCDATWIQLQPLSTTRFAWEDPYGQKVLDVKIQSEGNTSFHKFSFENPETCALCGGEMCCVQLVITEHSDIKVARFVDRIPRKGEPATIGRREGGLYGETNQQNKVPPMELTVEFGILGVSVVDQSPRELLYIYLERVYISYLTGSDSGTTSRFKLIVGHLQFDNQLPLTVMPVLLAPEYKSDAHRPVFKMTITMSNDNTDGFLIFPYVYVRVAERYWRISIHEPIIWALVDLYGSLRLDRLPGKSSVTNVDPELRIE